MGEGKARELQLKMFEPTALVRGEYMQQQVVLVYGLAAHTRLKYPLLTVYVSLSFFFFLNCLMLWCALII